MIQIPDDPIISCMERTGLPPWMLRDWPEDEPEDEEEEEDDE